MSAATYQYTTTLEFWKVSYFGELWYRFSLMPLSDNDPIIAPKMNLLGAVKLSTA